MPLDSRKRHISDTGLLHLEARLLRSELFPSIVLSVKTLLGRKENRGSLESLRKLIKSLCLSCFVIKFFYTVFNSSAFLAKKQYFILPFNEWRAK